MTLSSLMAMYSVMRDIPDARKVPMERGWVALYLYATCKFSNLLTLEQWAFEYGLPLFWYALYTHRLCAMFSEPILKFSACIFAIMYCFQGWLLSQYTISTSFLTAYTVLKIYDLFCRSDTYHEVGAKHTYVICVECSFLDNRVITFKLLILGESWRLLCTLDWHPNTYKCRCCIYIVHLVVEVLVCQNKRLQELGTE